MRTVNEDQTVKEINPHINMSPEESPCLLSFSFSLSFSSSSFLLPESFIIDTTSYSRRENPVHTLRLLTATVFVSSLLPQSLFPRYFNKSHEIIFLILIALIRLTVPVETIMITQKNDCVAKVLFKKRKIRGGVKIRKIR